MLYNTQGMGKKARPVFWYSLLIVAIGTAVYFFVHKEDIFSPCLPPLRYSVAPVDERFGLTQQDVVRYAKKAEALWENELDRNLFDYESDAKFIIRFSFDERQDNTMKSQELENTITDTYQEYDEILEDLDFTKEEIRLLVIKYNRLAREYDRDVTAFNEMIAQWNQGASSVSYEAIQEEQDELENQRREIESLAKEINAETANANTLAQGVNEKANVINKGAEMYNRLWDGMSIFNKGTHDGQEIVLYQFSSPSDLILTLAHEFGHALGIGHLDNPESLMYATAHNQVTHALHITPLDIEAARNTCQLD